MTKEQIARIIARENGIEEALALVKAELAGKIVAELGRLAVVKVR